MEVLPIIDLDEVAFTQAQKYMIWRTDNKDKYKANADKQNAKKKENSVKRQIAKCQQKLNALIEKEQKKTATISILA